MENCDFACDRANELHVVLDDNDSGIGVYFPKQSCRGFSFLVAHAGSGFVQQDKLRSRRKNHCNFNPLPLAMGQSADQLGQNIAKVQSIAISSTIVSALAPRARREAESQIFSRAVRPFITSGNWFLMPTPFAAI